MISLKNGTLKIGNDRNILNYCLDAALLLLFCSISTFGGAREGYDYIYYTGFFSVLGLTLLKEIFTTKSAGRLTLTWHSLWYGSFLLYGIASSLWAFSQSAAFVPVSRMTQIFFIGFIITRYIKIREDLERILSLLLWSTLIMTFVILIQTPVAQWFSGFIGKSAIGYNTNIIGLMASTGTMIAFYKAYILQKKIYYFAVAVPLMLIIMTSSRKSLFMSVFSIAMLIVLYTQKRYYIVRILAALAIIAAAGVAIIRIPVLYEAIGSRFVSLYQYFIYGRRRADTSVEQRQFFIRVAKSFFYEHPVVGIGLNNFGAKLSRSFTRSTYAHNNYWEIASGLGVVGLISYYWFYVYLLVKLFKNVLQKKALSVLFFVYTLLLLVTEYGMVSYYSRSEQIMLAIAFSGVFIEQTASRRAASKETVPASNPYYGSTAYGMAEN